MTKIPIALQLYSLRDVMPNDVAGTLQKLAAMGYAGVEFAGYYGLGGAELRAMLDANGLRCAGAHVRLEALEGDEFAATIAMNRALGNDRLIVPGADLNDLTTTIQRMNAAHAAAKGEGMRAGFHNHVREFDVVDGMTKFDRIFSETPDDFLVQVDIGWATAAGVDVAALLRKYAKRIETVHVKEFSTANSKAAVGEGSVEWVSIFEILEIETSAEWYIVEQEEYEIGPMESVESCIANIRKLGR